MATPWKHPNGTFYLRERVPRDLLSLAQRREVALSLEGEPRTVKLGEFVKLSLETKEPALAKDRYRSVSAEVQELWRRFRQERQDGPVTLTAKQIAGLAGIYYDGLCRDFEDDPGDSIGWEEAADVALRECCPELDGETPSPRRLREASQALEERFGKSADRILEGANLAITQESRRKLLRCMVDVFSQVARFQKRRAGGDFSPDSRAGRFPKLELPQVPKSTAPGDGLTLTELFNDWKAQHIANQKAEKTIRDYEQKCDSLREFVQTDRVSAITKAKVREWCNSLMSPEEGSGREPLKPKTVKMKYLAAVKTVFAVGVNSGKVTDNPTSGYTLRVAKPVSERSQGLTEDEARAILSATRSAMSGLGRMSEDNKRAIRWVPWICAFTGARVGEIAQLRREDFMEEGGIPYLRITPEAGAVKGRRYRDVPLHPQLVAEGLLEMVQSRGPGYLFFSADTAAEAVKRLRSVTGKISQWVRNDVKVTDPRISPNHAWRHRFKTLCIRCDVPPDYAEVLMGHEDGRAARGYGDYPIQALYREIKKLPEVGI